jgi:hypothetical protein
MGAIKTLLSFEEFERLEDEHEGKTELLEGELFHLPPPKRKHNRSSKNFFVPLNQQVKDCKSRNPNCQAGEVLLRTVIFSLAIRARGQSPISVSPGLIKRATHTMKAVR